MKKVQCKFDVSFNLNLKDEEKLCMDSLNDFKKDLEGFVYEWVYGVGSGVFLANGKGYDTDIFPTRVKVRKTIDKGS